MGFSLREIRELLQRCLAPQELRTILEARREVLKKRVLDAAGRLERIEARLNSISAGVAHSHPAILLRRTPGQWVVSLREKLQNYDQADELFKALERRVDSQSPHHQRAAVFHRCLETDGEIDCEAVRFLKHPVAPIRGVRVYRLQRTDVASAYHYGSEDSISTTYRAIAAWVSAQGYQLSAAKREIYWPGPENKDETSSLTEIQFPVTRSRSAARRLREKAS